MFFWIEIMHFSGMANLDPLFERQLNKYTCHVDWTFKNPAKEM